MTIKFLKIEILIILGTYFTILISQGLFNKDKPTSVSRGLFFSIVNMIGLAYLQKSDREALIHMVININACKQKKNKKLTLLFYSFLAHY